MYNTAQTLLLETAVQLVSSDKVLYRKLWLTHLSKAAGIEGRTSQQAASFPVPSPTATSTLLETCGLQDQLTLPVLCLLNATFLTP
jgi:hypothetical protein